MFSVVDVISKKVRGESLEDKEIQFMTKLIYEGKLDGTQLGAFLMALFIRGMTDTETAHLTSYMAHYGDFFDWSSFPWRDRVVDKHSTGGIGDKISPILAPMVVACGAKVPMISGRGLQTTGGTIDKLESIAGFNAFLDHETATRILNDVGVFITGQTEKVVPVDAAMYAARDVTGTVASLPLLSSSILSKKFTEDLRALIMDIKYGRGAFMKTEAAAEELAKLMISVAKILGLRLVAVIDNMDQPIGYCIGNALEIAEVLKCLAGEMPIDIEELVITQGSQMLLAAELARDIDDAKRKCYEAIKSGAAMEVFRKMLVAQGVAPELAARLCVRPGLEVEDYLRILNHPAASVTEILAPASGFVRDQDAQMIGTVVWRLGAGRSVRDQIIDYSVGVQLLKKIGDNVKEGEPWARVRHSTVPLDHALLQMMKDSLQLSDNRVDPPTLISAILQ